MIFAAFRFLALLFLIIILFSLFVFFLIILIPVSYSLHAEKGEDKEFVLFCLGWLFNVISLHAQYDGSDGLSYKASVLFLTVFSNEKDESEKESKKDSASKSVVIQSGEPDFAPKSVAIHSGESNSAPKSVATQLKQSNSSLSEPACVAGNPAAQEPGPPAPEQKEEACPADDPPIYESDLPDPDQKEEACPAGNPASQESDLPDPEQTGSENTVKDNGDDDAKQGGERSRKPKGRFRLNRFKNNFFIRLFRWFLEYENRDAVLYIWEQLKYVLWHMRFRKLQGFLDYGLGDPYETAKILELLSFVYTFTKGDIKIHPYFDKKMIEGELHIAGHLRLVHVFVAAVRLLSRREIRMLLLLGRKRHAE